MAKKSSASKKRRSAPARKHQSSGRHQPSRSNNERLRALMRSQEINEMLKRSMIESEALQSSGDDRPSGEDHISKLLEESVADKRLLKNVESQLAGGKRSRPASSKKRKRR